MDGWRLLRIGWKKDPMDEEEMRIETRKENVNVKGEPLMVMRIDRIERVLYTTICIRAASHCLAAVGR